jgi:hypothetical protein
LVSVFLFLIGPQARARTNDKDEKVNKNQTFSPVLVDRRPSLRAEEEERK